MELPFIIYEYIKKKEKRKRYQDKKKLMTVSCG